MHKEFIPYEQILELKELGFNGILWQEVFRWFREKHLFGHCINPYTMDSHIIDIRNCKIYYISEVYTYEEAELDCLKKLIEIVKNK